MHKLSSQLLAKEVFIEPLELDHAAGAHAYAVLNHKVSKGSAFD